MIQTRIEQEAEDLKLQLKEDTISSYNNLLTFSQSYCHDPAIQNEVLWLGSQIFDLFEEEASLDLSTDHRSNVLAEALKIVEDIVKQPATKDGVSAGEKLSRLRSQFLSARPNDVVFRAHNISKQFSSFRLNNINLQLRLGEITGVIGENGNGKSTLLKIVAGEVAPTEGKCEYPFIKGANTDWSVMKRAIGYVPQTLASWGNANSVKQQLRFTAAIKGIRGENNERAVDYIIMRLGLKKYADESWSNLSGGFQLRFELARQLVWNPKLLILDEPLANLDVKGQNMLLTDLRNLANSLRSPMSILLSSHDIYDVEHIADNIIFINDGNAKYNGPVTGISETNGYHCYMLDIECSVLELQKALGNLSKQILEIRDDFQHKLVFTSVDIDSEMLLKELLGTRIPLYHFRDISNSTRIFFENVQFSKKIEA